MSFFSSLCSTPTDNTLPLVVNGAQEIDFEKFASDHKDEIELNIKAFGSIVFKNFNIGSVSKFEKCAEQLCASLYTNYGDLPPTPKSEKIYGATPYPPDMTIHFHNEASHTPTIPAKQFFYCVQAAAEGGGLRVVDGRAVLKKLPQDIVQKFSDKKLKYYRNYIPYLDVSWQNFFKVTEKHALESICKKNGIDFKWDGDIFSTCTIAPAIITHPVLKELVWFNQIQLHHPRMLDEENYEALRYSYQETEFPRYVCFGDDSPISEEILSVISEVLEQESVTIQAKNGDIIYNDNLLVAHSRLPYSGAREVRVALGESIASADLYDSAAS